MPLPHARFTSVRVRTAHLSRDASARATGMFSVNEGERFAGRHRVWAKQSPCCRTSRGTGAVAARLIVELSGLRAVSVSRSSGTRPHSMLVSGAGERRATLFIRRKKPAQVAPSRDSDAHSAHVPRIDPGTTILRRTDALIQRRMHRDVAPSRGGTLRFEFRTFEVQRDVRRRRNVCRWVHKQIRTNAACSKSCRRARIAHSTSATNGVSTPSARRAVVESDHVIGTF